MSENKKQQQANQAMRMAAPTSVRCTPGEQAPVEKVSPDIDRGPMTTLDLAIRMGWGDTPQYKLPKDWRTRRNPNGRSGWE